MGRLLKAHGLKGAIKLELYTDSPNERFVPGAVLKLQVPETSPWFGKTVTVTEGKKKYTFKPSSAKASNTIKLTKGSHKLVIKGGSVSKTVTITVP